MSEKHLNVFFSLLARRIRSKMAVEMPFLTSSEPPKSKKNEDPALG
jgi:hypothetical protein